MWEWDGKRGASTRSICRLLKEEAVSGGRRSPAFQGRRAVAQTQLWRGALQHIDHAAALRSTNVSGAEEVSRRAADHGCGGVRSVGRAGEAVQHRLNAGRVQFEHDSRVCRAAEVRGSV